RAPDMQELYGVSAERGLVQVLQGEASLESVVYFDQLRGVHVLPAGTGKRSPNEIVSASSVRKLLSEARKLYRYVVLDTPPLLGASESLVFAQAADQNLICAMRDVTRLEQLQTACTRLHRGGGQLMGVVLSGVAAAEYYAKYDAYPRPESISREPEPISREPTTPTIA
ncbi:MAG: hypothetical protein N2C14_12095, partial [Planctomycetales bacterium]